MWEQIKGYFLLACFVMFLIALYQMGALDALLEQAPSVTVGP